ncbi:DoxX family protein [Gordonia liuliyuniae]|uniref:DoxX family protein n=1 Tax=Gordonia liuliyuniae TaxID=2911517 RepID=A0ABS9IP39_9ACTN|nr:DoxX family protein [Gordonia liuliyuniae]MCF8587316.1 DoxX family protein [Gordonia liuliyuniae]
MARSDNDRSGGLPIRLLLRAAVGGTMIAHGVKHARSLDGTAGWFGSIGFRQPRMQAVASAVVETGAGAAIVVGAGVPVAAAAVVGTMGVAARSVHAKNGFFITSEGWEYVANLAVSAVALAALGPGRWSVDHALGIDSKLSSAQCAAVAGGVGVASAATQLAAFHRPN